MRTIAADFNSYKLAMLKGIKHHYNSCPPADTLPFELHIMAIKVKYSKIIIGLIDFEIVN